VLKVRPGGREAESAVREGRVKISVGVRTSARAKRGKKSMTLLVLIRKGKRGNLGETKISEEGWLHRPEEARLRKKWDPTRE